MFEVNQVSEKQVNQYLNEVNPDGIYRNLMFEKSELVEAEGKASYINMTFKQVDTGKIYQQKLWCPKPGGSVARIEHMYLGLVRPKAHPVTGLDVRFGEKPTTIETFKELYEYYNSKINMDDLVPVDLKVLYKTDKVAIIDGKKQYPNKDLGSFPFMNSEFLKNTLEISKDLSNIQYPMFTSYTTTVVESLNSLSVPVAVVGETLPF